jgi:hypothetical protein
MPTWQTRGRERRGEQISRGASEQIRPAVSTGPATSFSLPTFFPGENPFAQTTHPASLPALFP